MRSVLTQASVPTAMRDIAVTVCLAVASTMGAAADSVAPQRSLDDLCRRSASVFRGTVLSATEHSLRAGGGTIPIVTYRLRVDETFKGQFATIKGVRVADVRMLRSRRHAGDRRDGLFLDLPTLDVGGAYVLMLTKPSAIGMSAPVGLGQGVFRMSGGGPTERVEAVAPSRGRMTTTYAVFARQLRQSVERTRRAQ